MRFRIGLVLGFGVGYLLGTKAGRERYEQIKRVTATVSRNPTVQQTTERMQAQARARAAELGNQARRMMHDKTDAFGHDFADRMSSKLPGRMSHLVSGRLGHHTVDLTAETAPTNGVAE